MRRDTFFIKHVPLALSLAVWVVACGSGVPPQAAPPGPAWILWGHNSYAVQPPIADDWFRLAAFGTDKACKDAAVKALGEVSGLGQKIGEDTIEQRAGGGKYIRYERSCWPDTVDPRK